MSRFLYQLFYTILYFQGNDTQVMVLRTAHFATLKTLLTHKVVTYPLSRLVNTSRDNVVFIFLKKCDEPIATFPADEQKS